MKRSLMQLYIRSSKEAVEFYSKAFQTTKQHEFLDQQGNYVHVELDVLGQTIACSHAYQPKLIGNTMQFCFQLNENEKDWMEHAYAILKENATIDYPLGECFYSRSMFSLIDQFGISWCMFL